MHKGFKIMFEVFPFLNLFIEVWKFTDYDKIVNGKYFISSKNNKIKLQTSFRYYTLFIKLECMVYSIEVETI